MSAIITDNMRLASARRFLRSVDDLTIYAFMGRPQAWTNDFLPPAPTGTVDESRQLHQSITSYKPVLPENVLPVTHRFNWTEGTTYQMYSPLLTPAAQEIPEGTYPYYVLTSNNDVYVCIYNGTSRTNTNGVPSVDEPTGAGTGIFTGPSDGYIWKFLYSVSSEMAADHLTNTYLPIPVVSSPLTSINGEVICVYPTTTGTGMANNTTVIPYYYCNVVGDGVGAVCRFNVVNGFINNASMIRTGRDYTFATVDCVDGRIYQSLNDLDAVSGGLSIGGTKPTFTIILPPPGGYTFDFMNTLCGYYLSVNVKARYGYQIPGGDVGFYTDMTFRQHGLIADMELSDGSGIAAAVNLSGCYAVKLSSMGQAFVFGETISQGNARGYVVHCDAVRNILFYIQTAASHRINNVMYRFDGTGRISGSSGGNGFPDTTYSGTVALAGVSFIDGYSGPQVKPGTGFVYYTSNDVPVQRSTTQIETMKYVVKF